MKSEKVHVPVIEKRWRFRRFTPTLWRPGCDSSVFPEPWFWV